MNLIWKTFILIGIIFVILTRSNYVRALQCYVCENCIELQVMQICGELPIESTVQPSTTLATASSTSSIQNGSSSTQTAQGSSTNRPITTNKDDDDSDSDDSYSDYDDSDEDRHRDRDDIRTVTVVESTSASEQSTASSAAIMINEDSYEDATEMKVNHNLPKQFAHVCYMVKYRANGTESVSLGCTSMKNENEYLTCQSLNQTNAIIEDCRLCGSNGCNKYFFNSNGDDDHDYDYLNSSVSVGRNKVLLKLFISLLVIKIFVL